MYYVTRLTTRCARPRADALRIKIKIILLGRPPENFRPRKVPRWTSAIFEIKSGLDYHALRCQSDLPNWTFSDCRLNTQLPQIDNSELLIAIVNVPLEDNWFTRKLADGRIVLTFHEIKEILDSQNIPLENIVYRIMYVYALAHLANISIDAGIAHDEARGCIFDFNGIKSDIVASCHRPILCPQCAEMLRSNNISENLIASVQEEVKNIRKDLYYRILERIRKHPVLAIIISTAVALIVGIMSSLISSFIYDKVRAHY